MTRPLPKEQNQNTKSCNTCKYQWKKQSELKESHCHFCGTSNCKACLKKTRYFLPEQNAALDKSGREKRI